MLRFNYNRASYESSDVKKTRLHYTEIARDEINIQSASNGMDIDMNVSNHRERLSCENERTDKRIRI